MAWNTCAIVFWWAIYTYTPTPSSVAPPHSYYQYAHYFVHHHIAWRKFTSAQNKTNIFKQARIEGYTCTLAQYDRLLSVIVCYRIEDS
jgi:hypothetical protein